MTLHIELSAQVSERLTTAARSRGIDLSSLVETLVTEHLPSIDPPTTPASFPPPGRAAQRLRARLAAESTDDPEVIRMAEESLDAMKLSMNSERRRSGAEPIF